MAGKGISDQVAIIGMGCSKFGERWDMGPDDLLVEAAYEAFEDAGVEAKDIEAAWLGTYVTAFTGQLLAQALKLEYIPISRVEKMGATATDAFRNACFGIASGQYDIVMVAGVEKLKDTGFTGLGSSVILPNTNVMPPAPPPAQFALSATRYFHHYGIEPDQGRNTLAQIAVQTYETAQAEGRGHQDWTAIYAMLREKHLTSPN